MKELNFNTDELHEVDYDVFNQDEDLQGLNLSYEYLESLLEHFDNIEWEKETEVPF